MNFDTVIFDMDGVVIDSGMVWNVSTTKFLQSYGFEYNYVEVRPKVVGTSLKDSTEIIRNHYGIEADPKQFFDNRMKFIRAEFEKGINYIPGFTNFHERVKDLGIKTGIATSAHDEVVNYAVKHLKLLDIFDGHLYKASDVGDKSKPDPSVYLHAAQMLASNPATCIVVEDAPKGVDAAHNAGMKCIGITTTFPSDLIQQADWVVDRYEEIPILDILGLPTAK